MQPATICALASPRGEGGVNVVRISGPQAVNLLGQFCKISNLVPRRVHLRTLVDPQDATVLDQSLVCYMPKPGSYTGEDVVEIFAHGGTYNAERLVDRLLHVGKSLDVRAAEPGEFTRRAFLNGKIELTQAEAVGELIAAQSERAWRNAQALLSGELGRQIGEIRQRIIDVAADLEACIDFAEDVTEPVERQVVRAKLQRCCDEVDRLAATYQQGKKLNGVVVGLAGAVNVGKSSLLNALAGRTRALVSNIPGTTRDYLEMDVHWGDQRLTLIDTAGLRDRNAMGELERAGSDLASDRLKECDAMVYVVDLTRLTTADAFKEMAVTPTVIVGNKMDCLSPLENAQRCEELSARFGVPSIAVSALTGKGIADLQEKLCALIRKDSGESRETVQVTRERQWRGLVTAKAHLDECAAAHDDNNAPELCVEHLRRALSELGQITGESFSEQILDSVFARFCIGK